MNELALFAGAGGGLLAGRWLNHWRTVCYVEREPYAVAVLRARIRDGLLDDAPIWDDVRTFDGRPWRGYVDIVTAGFPCQPFSVAGRRLAGDDERNGWPDTIRIIRDVQPHFAFLENVPNLLTGSHGYFGQILGDLAQSGYDCRWRCLSAAELGAPHKRDRLWVVAHHAGHQVGDARQPRAADGETADALSVGLEGPQRGGAHPTPWPQATERRDPHADNNEVRWDGWAGEFRLCRWAELTNGDWWQSEPGVGRVVHGLVHRMDRIKALGNGQVPVVAAAAWQLLTEAIQ